MDSDNDQFLPASQMLENENETEHENGDSQGAGQSDQGQSQAQGQDNTQQGKNTRQNKAKEKTKPTKEKEPAGPVKDPCVYCGKHCAKGTVQCAQCALWCHMSCTGLSKEALRGLEIQAKEVGKAYWACRGCMNFNTIWNNQMKEVSRRQDETEAKVASNSDKIEEVRMVTEELRREL